jgi:uncharacterized protein YdeI (YjbR/CyaY-like superfamily)
VATEQPTLSFESQRAFEKWLAKEHKNCDGIWLKIAKKGSGISTVTYQEALEVALCFGWIDGQRKRYDDDYYIQRFTPRRARSKWSKINVGKVEELIAAGKMKPAGLAEVERAKTDGRWDAAYDSPTTATVPDDLVVALQRSLKAAAAFETLTSSHRYSILYQVQDAKRPETRARRIEKFVDMLERGQKPGD